MGATDFRDTFVDLAQPRLGSRVVFATDDFFAPKERLIDPAEPVFVPDKYDENGKWMDGWESRRRRSAGHDYCVLRLGRPGLIEGVNIDTRHFTGNYPPAASLEACRWQHELPDDTAQWRELLPRTPLQGDRQHLLRIRDRGPWTHLRFHIYPDGGIARLRVYGRVHVDWPAVDPGASLDLAAMENGGRALLSNDEHFGRLSNILAPGPGSNMGDGWETRRRREPGHDWGVIELGHAGLIDRIVVDTAFFKGNYPERCFIQATGEPVPALGDLPAASSAWPLLLPEQRLEADAEQVFTTEIRAHSAVRLVRINIVPDGGVSRLRLFGRIQ